MKAIYGIINKINGNKYVGSAVNFYRRKSVHLQQLRGNVHHSKYLQRAWKKYGENNFEFIILEKIDNKEQLLIREQWWLDNSNNAYNVCKVAGSPLGVKRTDATKAKCRLAHLGKILSVEHKDNISKSCDSDMMRKKQALSILSRKTNNKKLSKSRVDEIRLNNSVEVLAISDELCHIFPSYKIAATFLGKSEVTLWRMIKSKKEYNNFIWIRKKDYVQS